MGTAHSTASRVFVNELHVSGEITGWSASKTCELADATGLTAEGGMTTVGHVGGSIKIPGMLSDGAGTLTTEAGTVLGTEDALLVTVCPNGTTIGQTALIAVCDLENFVADASVKSTVSIALDAKPDSGVDWGITLHAHAAETADGNSASVDNAALTSNGGAATLHATAFSGLTNAIVKVQHSTDNSTWVDLVTFATVTAVTSERVLVAAAATVNRYLRATVDVTGVGSVTYLVAFARR